MNAHFHYADGTILDHHDGSKNVVKIEWANGAMEYYKDGLLHRDNDQPALIHADGSKEYWVDGKRRDFKDGVAIEWANGKKEYFDENKLKELDPRLQ